MADTPTDTAAALAAAQKALADAEAANNAAVAQAEANLPPDAILGELVTLVCSRLGNPPDIEDRVKRYNAAIAPPPPTPPAP